MTALPDDRRDDPPALTMALDLLARGMWPVPIHVAGTRIGTNEDGTPNISEGKEPIGKAWGKVRPTPGVLRAVYAATPKAGVGVKLGLDVGVIDIENDTGAEGEATFVEMMAGEEFESLGWLANRGFHYLAQADPRLAKYGKTIIKIGGLEIRIGTINIREPKQIQSVVPPTPKGDGTPRRSNGHAEILPLPESFFAYLDRAIAVEPDRKPRTTIPIYTPKPGEWTAEDRAIAYLSRIEPGVSGQGGSSPAFRAACKIGPGFGLSEDRAAQILLEHYAPRCTPPWSEKEIRHKIADAYRVETRRGWMIEEGRNYDARPNGGNGQRAESGASSVSSVDPAQMEDDRPAVVQPWPKPPSNAVWHGPAGELALAVEPYTEGDPMGILVQTLVAVGNMWGRRVYSQVGSTRHYTNLFACTAGKTSAGRKGTAWDIVKGAVARCDPEYAERRIKGGLSSGEGLIYAVRDPVTKKAPVRDKGRIVDYQDEIVDDGVSDKRLLVTETEFGRTLGVMGREGNTLSSVIRQAWDTDTLDSLTKGNTNRATNAHVSIVAHVTAMEVTKLLTSLDAANGFANRFIWVAVRKTKSLPAGRAIPAAAVDRPINRIVDATTNILQTEHRMTRTKEAEGYWESVYDSLAPDHPGLLGSILGRGQPQVLRLAMIYALLDGHDRVAYEHLDAAIALWRYCEASALYIFGDAMGDREADRLLSELRKSPDGLSRTTIQNVVFQKNKTTEELDRILGRLVEAKLICSARIPTDGRDRTVWKSNDYRLTEETD